MKVSRRAARAAVASMAIGGLVLGSALPTQASDADADRTATDPIAPSKSALISGADVMRGMKGAEHAHTAREKVAVDEYLDGLSDSSIHLAPEDLKVATVSIADDLSMAVVAPESVAVHHVDVEIDGDRNEVSIGAAADLPAHAQAETAGPGMSGFQPWHAVPTWEVAFRMYYGGDFIGSARIETAKRRIPESAAGESNTNDTWQVSRYLRADPQSWTDGHETSTAYVATLWASSRLSDDAQAKAQQHRSGATTPDEGFSNCSGGTTLSPGPFASFTVQDCADYDVWEGNPGHYRFAYDQGAWAGGDVRTIAYEVGWTMDQGAATPMRWYQFVTFRLGHASSGKDLKCKSEARGAQDGILKKQCDWASDDWGNAEEWADHGTW